MNMAELDRKKTYRNLKKKGFLDAEHREDGHKYLELFHEGKLVLFTRISHSGNIGTPLIAQMAMQCGLSNHQFLDLARCPMSQDKYLSILDGKGYL